MCASPILLLSRAHTSTLNAFRAAAANEIFIVHFMMITESFKQTCIKMLAERKMFRQLSTGYQTKMLLVYYCLSLVGFRVDICTYLPGDAGYLTALHARKHAHTHTYT